jgi:hypothetical protein
VERKYSSYSFMTSALDGVSGQSHAPQRFTPGERTPVTHCTGGWVSEQIWTQRLDEKSSASTEDRTPIVRPSSP